MISSRGKIGGGCWSDFCLSETSSTIRVFGFEIGLGVVYI